MNAIFSKFFWVGAALALALSGCSKVGTKKPDHGGEQGLELGNMDLQEDYAAALDALQGWWKESQKTLQARMDWYNDAKFGCFVHWGPYSMLESKWNGRAYNGYAEHIMRMAKIPVEDYKNKVVKVFDPNEFDADEWMQQVKKAGMKYFVVTAKHHDGFAMWHSDAYRPRPDYPSFDADCPTYDMRMTSFDKNRDPMAELRAAAKRYGIKFGFYYSHAFDWEHPFAPGNDWDDFRSINGFEAGRNPGGDLLLGTAKWWNDDSYKGFLGKADYYLNSKSLKQAEELVKKYEPDIMWFDTPHKLPIYQNIAVCRMLRKLKGDLVINGRLARWEGHQLGDYVNSSDRAAFLFPLASEYWETIPTTNNSYGYSSTDNSHKPPEHFIRLVAAAASKGGNVLMNVGPMGNGKWDFRDIGIFSAIGAWMDKNGESIYGTTRTNDIPIPNWGVITKKGDKLYLHVHQWPSSGALWLGSLSADIQSANILSTGQALAHSQVGKDIKINVPVDCPDASSTVIVLTLRGGYKAFKQRLLDPKVKNELQAFDAMLTGAFSNGDGKVSNNYLSDWKSADQYITWNVSLHEQKTFNFSLAYNGSGSAGVVTIEIDGVGYDMSYASTSVNARGSVSPPKGAITLAAGDHVIRLKGKSNGGEFLRPKTLTLEPE
jgi:alpha-L-fucosidase